MENEHTQRQVCHAEAGSGGQARCGDDGDEENWVGLGCVLELQSTEFGSIKCEERQEKRVIPRLLAWAMEWRIVVPFLK